MRRPHVLVAGVALASLATMVGCVARSPDRYREDTATLLGTRGPVLTSCYNSALAAEPGAHGRVAVRFKLQEETGKLVEPAVDAAQTTAPPQLTECVMRSLDGLVLTPPDARDGEATFVWEFSRPAAPSSG